jgi:hypothetical protein
MVLHASRLRSPLVSPFAVLRMARNIYRVAADERALPFNVGNC